MNYQQPVVLFGAEAAAGVSECRQEQQRQQLPHVPAVDGVV